MSKQSPVREDLGASSSNSDPSQLCHSLVLSEPQQQGVAGLPFAIPSDKCIEDWFGYDSDDEIFWKRTPYRTNGDVVEEIKTAVRYFMTTWQNRIHQPPATQSPVQEPSGSIGVKVAKFINWLNANYKPYAFGYIPSYMTTPEKSDIKRIEELYPEWESSLNQQNK